MHHSLMRNRLKHMSRPLGMHVFVELSLNKKPRTPLDAIPGMGLYFETNFLTFLVAEIPLPSTPTRCQGHKNTLYFRCDNDINISMIQFLLSSCCPHIH